MRRRTVLVGVGGLVAGASGLVGSAAFSSSAAYGTVELNVDGEDVAVYESLDDANDDENRAADLTLDGEIQENRVNVDDDALALRHTADDGTYDVSVTLTDGGGAPLENLDDFLGDDIHDVRLFTTGDGNNDDARTFIDTSEENMRESLDTADDEYLDQNRKKRGAVPGVGQIDTRGAVGVESGETVQIGVVISVGDDASDTTLPDFRIDIEEA